jgi:hypothetical protein
VMTHETATGEIFSRVTSGKWPCDKTRCPLIFRKAKLFDDR